MKKAESQNIVAGMKLLYRGQIVTALEDCGTKQKLFVMRADGITDFVGYRSLNFLPVEKSLPVEQVAPEQTSDNTEGEWIIEQETRPTSQNAVVREMFELARNQPMKREERETWTIGERIGAMISIPATAVLCGLMAVLMWTM